jgi:hypothetical protein
MLAARSRKVALQEFATLARRFWRSKTPSPFALLGYRKILWRVTGIGQLFFRHRVNRIPNG